MFDSLHFQETNLINSPQLQEDQVHLWWMSLSITKKLQEEFVAGLNGHQRQKLDRIKDVHRRQFYVAGRGYLNQLLMHYVGNDSGIELQFGQHGKPSLKNNSKELRFNFTDTCGYGLFAFAWSSELGVDLENTQREGKFERIVQRRFAPEEQYLSSGTMSDFLHCWTRKEAFGKAKGVGLNYPLREHLLCEDMTQNECLLEQEGFYGQQFSIEVEKDKFVACLFSEGQTAKELIGFRLLSN